MFKGRDSFSGRVQSMKTNLYPTVHRQAAALRLEIRRCIKQLHPILATCIRVFISLHHTASSRLPAVSQHKIGGKTRHKKVCFNSRQARQGGQSSPRSRASGEQTVRHPVPRYSQSSDAQNAGEEGRRGGGALVRRLRTKLQGLPSKAKGVVTGRYRG